MAHLGDPRVTDVAALLRRAAKVGVEAVVSAGVDPRRFPALPPSSAVAVWRADGLHPEAIDDDPREVVTQLRLLEQRVSTLVAIGEIGLDGRDGMPPWSVQTRVFRAQLDLARQHRLPVIIHSVRATGRLLDVLAEVGPLPAGGMLHGFSGPAEIVVSLAELGIEFSFGGVVTRGNARRVHRAAQAVPDHCLLVESGTPDHPPERPPNVDASVDGRSEPAHVWDIVCALADLRGQDPGHVARLTRQNAARLFRP